MKARAEIRDGIIYYPKEVFEFLTKHNGAEIDLEITVINKPEHYLYRYLFGFLIKDIAQHSGESVGDIHMMMKERFATEHVKSWEDVPERHRKHCDRYEKVNANDEVIDRWYIKSAGAMTHEELQEYVKNVELHFFDFMQGALSKKHELEAYEMRKMGMMTKEELKKYRKTKGE